MIQFHPDLKKKAPNITIRPKSIWFFRVLLRYIAPREKSISSVQTSIKYLDGVEMRFHIPKDTNPTSLLIWIHGGGLIVGQPSQDDYRCSVFAKELGIAVVAVKYRLAPQHPYPAAIDDCFAVWKTIQTHAVSLGINPHKIAIGGASAGGGLAANLALRIRDEGGIQPVCQLLVYPMLDDRTILRTDIAAKENYVWNNVSNATGWNSYLKTVDMTKTPKYAAASRHLHLENLPPAWIGVGSLDLFYKEDLDYGNRLSQAGVSTVLEVVQGGYHGFEDFDKDAPVSKEFVSKMIHFLRPLL